MFYFHRRLRLLPFGLAPAVCLGTSSVAAAPDADYETIVPATRAAVSVPPSANPPGLAASPLAVSAQPAGPHPEMRFVMRDGSVLVGQVLGFDGQMYALKLPHSTILARKDFFAAITPVTGGPKKAPVYPIRAVGVRVGARY